MVVEFQKFDCYTRDLVSGVHAGVLGNVDTLAVFLTNDVVDRASQTVKSDLTEVDTGNGYDGPIDTDNDATVADGVVAITGTDILLIGTGPGAIGPFRYAVLCNLSQVLQPLIGYWDYGGSISVSMGEQFALTFTDSLLLEVA